MVGRVPLQVQDPWAPKLHHKKIKVNDKYIGEVTRSKRGTFQSLVLDVLEQSCGLSDNGMDCKCGKSPNLSNETDPSVPGVWREVAEAHIDATPWKVARSAATMPSLVRSENPVAWETVSTPITHYPERGGAHPFPTDLALADGLYMSHTLHHWHKVRTLSIMAVSCLPLTLPNRARK